MPDRSRISPVRHFLLAAAVACFATACTPVQTPAPPEPGGAITVFAAASLRSAFTELGANFLKANPGMTVGFSFGGSQQLAEQIANDAPADVFASANQALIGIAAKTGRIDASAARTFARNRLIVIYPHNNPGRISRLRDLNTPGLKLVLANKHVPVGAYALAFLNTASARPEFGADFGASVLSNVVSYEEDVRAVFNKVALGEADAGIVYASDVFADARSGVGKIDIPDELNTIANYPIAPLKDSKNPALAQAFVNYVLSPEAQAVLVKHGFSTAADPR